MKKETLENIEIITNFIEKNKKKMTPEEVKTFKALSKLLPMAMDVLEEENS